jgi:hypothetical protein
MPEWNVEQILAVHFRMHQAEGVLFSRCADQRCAEVFGEMSSRFQRRLCWIMLRSTEYQRTDLSKQINAHRQTRRPAMGQRPEGRALAAMVALQF